MARKRPKITDWLETAPKDTTVDTTASFKYLLGALRSRAPGQWSQNLLELSRHFTSVAYLAINTMATQAAAADAKLWEINEDTEEGDYELPRNEPVCQLLQDPNGDDTLGDLLYQISTQLSLTGISLVWMPQLSENDIPQELYCLSSASALPWPPSPLHPHGSYLIQPYYPYGPFSTIPSYQSAAGARIPAEQILRIKNHHPYLRYDGYAVLTALQRQIDTVEAIDLSRWNTQQRGTDPTLAVELDPEILDLSIEDTKRLRTQLENLYAGPLGSKVLVNPVGTKLNPISNTPAEMAWQEGWSQLVDFALAAYQVPRAVAGLQADLSYSTLYSSLRAFYVLSLNPLLRKISGKFTKHLIRPYFGDDLYCTLEGQKITDEELLLKRLHLEARYGTIKRNELRKEFGRAPLPGPEGEELIKRPANGGDRGSGMGQGGPDADFREDVERPDNDAGEGSLPQRAKAISGDRLALLLEKAKTNGTALTHNGDH